MLQILGDGGGGGGEGGKGNILLRGFFCWFNVD